MHNVFRTFLTKTKTYIKPSESEEFSVIAGILILNRLVQRGGGNVGTSLVTADK